MASILIQPAQLRSTAQTLRQKASTINTALNSVENLMAELNSYSFAGNRAAAVRSRFSQIQGQLISSSALVTQFAQELEVSADVFEKADQGNTDSSSTVPTPTPTPTISPIQSSIDQFLMSAGASADFERLINTLLAVSPLIIQTAFDGALGKVGLEVITHIKDVYDLLGTGKAWNSVTLAQTNWQNAASQYGDTSSQASAAYDSYTTAWENVPFIGDVIKAAIDMGRANPVVSD